MALNGIKVLEFIGLAPAPFCGMVLANLGATVTVVEKMTPEIVNILSNGKRSIAVNTKSAEGKEIVKKLAQQSDVLIEPYRPGVMEKLGLGPEILLTTNPKLIYARLTGYGQNGELSKEAGHDINYVALTGVLSLLGRKESNPLPPLNILADFAGGGFLCAFGIIAALFERTKSGKGQVLDASMAEGVAYLSTWIYNIIQTSLWTGGREENFLDGGAAFYETYQTKDRKYISVGAIEPHFYDNFLRVLGLSKENFPQYSDSAIAKAKFSEIFLKETQDHWCEAFKGANACVLPVLSVEQAYKHPHNVKRKLFSLSHDGDIIPNPAPKFSRTPSIQTMNKPVPRHGEHTREILKELNYTPEQITKLLEQNVITYPPTSRL